MESEKDRKRVDALEELMHEKGPLEPLEREDWIARADEVGRFLAGCEPGEGYRHTFGGGYQRIRRGYP